MIIYKTYTRAYTVSKLKLGIVFTQARWWYLHFPFSCLAIFIEKLEAVG